jgi:c(7)-type cytochrome triheme protein
MNKHIKLTVHRPDRPVIQKLIPAVIVLCAILIGAFGYGNDFFPDHLMSKSVQLPSAHFPHEDHMGFLECLDCHHNFKDGTNVLDEDELYEGNPDIQCAFCHNGKKSFSRLRAFHRQCIQCHATEGQGPVVCAQCHTKN